MKDDFERMSYDQRLMYIIEHLRNLPDDIAEQAVDILIEAGETEYAVVLARDKGMIKKAIAILVNEGDYLWAALIAKNVGMADESKRLYEEGLKFYIEMEMFGRALSAATALKFPQEEIDSLFMKGIEVESRGTDLAQNRAMLDNAMESLEIALIGRQDEISGEIIDLIRAEKSRMAERKKNED